MLPNRFLLSLALTVLGLPVTAWSQTPLAFPVSSDVSPFRIYGPDTADTERQVSATSSPMIGDPDTYPTPSAIANAPPWRIITDTKFDATCLPKNGPSGLGITDIEFASTLNVDCILAPILITPYAAVHYWNGPSGLGLPTHLYDMNVEFAWRPRLAEWLFADLAVTPGLYTDFKNVSADSFQMRGRALGIIAFSEKLQLAGGAMYVNRNLIKVLPAGGVIWKPSDDTRYFLVFPQPKVSHRFCTLRNTQLWGYVAGEFGGGRWEIERAPGVNDSLDYTDLRLLLGIESVHQERLRGHVEFGYVFSRRVNFNGDAPDFRPESTLMFRAGLRF